MSASVIIRPTKRPRLRGSGSRFQAGLGHISLSHAKTEIGKWRGISAPFERHAGAFAFQGLTAERQEALADRVEDPANPYVVLVGRPRLRVFLPSVNAMWQRWQSPYLPIWSPKGAG